MLNPKDQHFLDFMLVLTNHNEDAAKHILGCKECKSVIVKILAIRVKDVTQNITNNANIDDGLYLVKQHLSQAGIQLRDTQGMFYDLAGDPLQ